MPTILETFTAAGLAVGLAGCVGTAGISTWDYQAGPGYETERVRESRIQADPVQGLTHHDCTSVTRRQVAASGEVSGADLTACRSD